MRVECDPENDRANRIKHGLSFDEVVVLFESDAGHLVIYDEEHSEDEDRFIAIGAIAKDVVTVAHTEPSEAVLRIISARLATRTEQELFYRRVACRLYDHQAARWVQGLRPRAHR